MDLKLLAIYLQDHLAGASAGRELVKRAHASNASTSLGTFLADLTREIEEDRQSLLEAMRRVEVTPDRVKQALGIAGERVGRLKLNGRLRGYSPLSRVVELEGLAFGVHSKMACWRTLAAASVNDARLRGLDFAALIDRAGRQLEQLEDHRRKAIALL
ncbi:MAG: hypothetical protein H0V55_00045 [Thermoleophilaceae bacterium]|nr:hypothetical protein [Thermoleophilaceae bacterium]MBA3839046.1 hypothetical protein [Thermoleophilaceae bacterium]